jgi:hypothetical protein
VRRPLSRRTCTALAALALATGCTLPTDTEVSGLPSEVRVPASTDNQGPRYVDGTVLMTPIELTIYDPDGLVLYRGAGIHAAVVHQGASVPVQARAASVLDGLAEVSPTGVGGPHGSSYPGETWVSDDLDAVRGAWSSHDAYTQDGRYVEQAIHGHGARILRTQTRLDGQFVQDEYRDWEYTGGGWTLRETRLVTYGNGRRSASATVTVGTPVQGSLLDLALDASGDPVAFGYCLDDFAAGRGWFPCSWELYRSYAYALGAGITAGACLAFASLPNCGTAVFLGISLVDSMRGLARCEEAAFRCHVYNICGPGDPDGPP